MSGNESWWQTDALYYVLCSAPSLMCGISSWLWNTLVSQTLSLSATALSCSTLPVPWAVPALEVHVQCFAQLTPAALTFQLHSCQLAGLTSRPG